MIKWLIGLAVLAILLMLALIVLAALTGFPDIPCQDGIWDDAKNTCIQTGT